MPSRTAKFMLAIFAGVLAATPLTTMSPNAAGAVDDCLSGPKGETPEGGHWYYRVDHANKRQCWYLREEGEKRSKVAPSNTSASARPVSPKTETAMQRSIADARAELPAQTRIEQPNRGDRLTSADVAISEINRDTKPPVAETPSVVASRWLDQSDADPSSTLLTSPTPLTQPLPNPAPVASPATPLANPSAPLAGPLSNKDYPGANLNVASQTQPPPSPLAAGQFAAPDLSSEPPTHSVQMLLAAIMGALAVAAVMGRLIFKLVDTRRRAKRTGRGRREAIWKSAATSRRASRVYPGADAQAPRPDFPRDLDQVGDPDDRIAELLRDFSRKDRKVANERQPNVGLSL